MRTPLICYHCEDACGVVIDHGRDEPDEILPWDENLIDEQSRCFCSEECMNAENNPGEEESDDGA